MRGRGDGREEEAEIRLRGKFGGSVIFSFLFVFMGPPTVGGVAAVGLRALPPDILLSPVFSSAQNVLSSGSPVPRCPTSLKP